MRDIREYVPGISATLLLTATVAPDGCAFTARADPALRREDYRMALKKWIDAGVFKRLVWCESSQSDPALLADLVERARARGADLEILTFAGQDFPKHRGKGYGEMGIIAHALAHSRLLKEATHVFKITGRYFVANAASLVRCVDETDPVPDVVCDLRENLTLADSRWFAGTLAFFREHLVPQREMIDDTVDIYFEHALARAVHSAMATGMGWRLPAASARLVGITATTNLPIAIGPGKRIRHRLKNWLFRY